MSFQAMVFLDQMDSKQWKVVLIGNVESVVFSVILCEMLRGFCE